PLRPFPRVRQNMLVHSFSVSNGSAPTTRSVSWSWISDRTGPAPSEYEIPPMPASVASSTNIHGRPAPPGFGMVASWNMPPSGSCKRVVRICVIFNPKLPWKPKFVRPLDCHTAATCPQTNLRRQVTVLGVSGADPIGDDGAIARCLQRLDEVAV